jgi:hypothetical protein
LKGVCFSETVNSVHFIRFTAHMSEQRVKRRRRISFTPDEDDRLRELVSKYGTEDWAKIASKMPKRETRQCRERWLNYLAPSVIRAPWTAEEDAMLIQKVNELGRKWQQIAHFFKGRTDINVKNRWNHLRKHNLLGPVPETIDALGQWYDGMWPDCPGGCDGENFGL